MKKGILSFKKSPRTVKSYFEQVPTLDGAYLLEITDLAVGSEVTIKDEVGNTYSEGIFNVLFNGQNLIITVIDNKITEIKPAETQPQTPTTAPADEMAAQFKAINKKISELEQGLNKFQKALDNLVEKKPVQDLTNLVQEMAAKFDKAMGNKKIEDSKFFDVTELRKKYNL